MNSNNSKVIIIRNSGNPISNTIDTYLGACAAGWGIGTGMGAMAGAVVGGIVGFAVPAITPILAGYGLGKAVKTMLRR
jgi:hypothetical protein